MSNCKETAVFNVSKECFANQKEDSGFVEFIAKQISSELSERVMEILDREEEIIVRQSDLRVSEFVPTQSIEYRRQINWSPLVRCKDCKHNYHNMIPGGEAEHGCTKCIGLPITADFFCSWGERREDG